MNCANHPETPVSAYCQNCGKALCQQCVRSVGGIVYCEPCLTARLSTPGVGPGSTRPVYVGLPASGAPNPGLALGLGFIPGVGAMYNGQFVKGLAHVFVFALLISFASHESFFGILIPFWIAYQVFDAYQTARARLDGTPLPNPFGLNDLGYRLGLQQHPEGSMPPVSPMNPQPMQDARPPSPSTTPYAAAAGEPVAPSASYQPPNAGYAAGFAPGFTPGFTPGVTPGFTPGVTDYTPGIHPQGSPLPPYAPDLAAVRRSDIPTGAIVLIAFGVLFLLGSLGIFHDDWIGRSWPLLIVGIGVWLVIRRTRETRARNGDGRSL